MSGWKYYPYNDLDSGRHCTEGEDGDYCPYYDPDIDDEWPIVNHPGETCAALHVNYCPGRKAEEESDEDDTNG